MATTEFIDLMSNPYSGKAVSKLYSRVSPDISPKNGMGPREVVARFDAGHLTSDGGALLLREADLRLDLTRRIAACFADGRQSGRVEHGVEELVAQRVHGLAKGSRLPARPSGVRAGGRLDCWLLVNDLGR